MKGEVQFFIVFGLVLLFFLFFVSYQQKGKDEHFSSENDLMYNLDDNSIREGDKYADDAVAFSDRATGPYGIDRESNIGFFGV